MHDQICYKYYDINQENEDNLHFIMSVANDTFHNYCLQTH